MLQGNGEPEPPIKEEASPPPIRACRLLWRKEVPFLYDLMAIHRRDSQVCSLAWAPGAAATADGAMLQRLIAGTAESLLLLAVRLPHSRPAEAPSTVGSKLGGNAAAVAPEPRTQVRLTHQMPHEGPAAQLAHSPHKEFLLATLSGNSGDVLLFDAARWQARSATCCPDLRLRAGSAALTLAAPDHGTGSGLAWSLQQPAHLLASMPGGGVRLWDAQAAAPVADFAGGLPVTAVAFSHCEPHMFATCGRDGQVCQWDARAGASPVCAALAHEGGAHSAAFGLGVSSRLLATGGADVAVRLWDFRRLKEVHALKWDTADGKARLGAISRLEWAPFDDGLLVAAGESGHVLVWDLSQVNARLTAVEAREGPPELAFVHGGHVGEAALAASWSLAAPWLLASSSAGAAGAAGELHFWRPSPTVTARRSGG